MRTMILDDFQNSTRRVVKVPSTVSALPMFTHAIYSLVQLLEPLIDHDYTKALSIRDRNKAMINLRSDDATIKVAPEWCLPLTICDDSTSGISF